MNILIFSTYLHHFAQGKTAGGKERQQYLIFSELSKQGVNVTAVTGANSEGQSQVNGIKCINNPVFQADNHIDRIKKAVEIRKIIKNLSPDICYIRGNWGYLPALVNLKTDTKIVFGVSNDRIFETSKNSLSYYLKRFGLRRVDSIICQTDYQSQEMKQTFGRSAHIIPNGYKKFQKNKINNYSSREYFLWVGRIESHKNPDRFLDIAESIPSQSFKLIGDPGSDDELNERIDDRASSISNVIYEGYVEPDKVLDHYNSAIAYIHTSTEEGFPNTFLEAWRCGTPVLSLEYDIGQLLSDKKGGILCESQEDMIFAVKKLVSDESFWKQLSEHANTHFNEKYTIESVVNQYKEVFKNKT